MGGKKPHARYNFHVLIINHSDSKSLCRNSNETAGITPESEIKLNRFQRMIMSRFDMLSPFIPNLRNFQSMSACATFSTDGQMAAAFRHHPRHELLASGGCLNEHPRLIGHVQITALRARHWNIVIIGHCRKMITPCENWKGRE